MPRDEATREVSYDIELPNRPRFALAGIPKAVTRSDFRVWCWLLRVSEEQEVRLQECFRAHEEVQFAARRKLVLPLLDQSAEIYAKHMPGTLESGLLLDRLYKHDRPALIRELERVDQSLFAAMSLHLSEEQFLYLEAVKSMRKRAMAFDSSALCPGANIDMLVVLHEVLQVRDWPAIANEEQLASLITSYGSEATAVFERRCDALIATRSDGSVLQKQYLSGLVNPDWARGQIKQLRTRLVSIERRIHDINQRYVDLFGQLLDEDTRQLLLDVWRVSTYEPVYPDPCDTSSLFEAALGIAELDEGHREQIESLFAATAADHELLNAQMVKRFLAYREEHGIEWRYGEIYDQYAEDITRLHEQRLKLAKQEIEWLRASMHAQAWQKLESDANRLVREMELFELVPDRRRGRTE